MLEDAIQLSHTITCGPYQLYFYKNLFFSDKDSKLHNFKILTNAALETLLDELFSLNRESNERIINKYIEQRRIQMT